MKIFTHPLFRHHDTGNGHPETACRMDSAIDGALRAGLGSRIEAAPAEPPETSRIIHKVHSAHYQRELEVACLRGDTIFQSSLDNPISAQSYAAARASVATTLAAANEIWKTRSERRAFVIARPPGHHAERSGAMGFCFFNTIACAAEALRELPEIERVFIFDWDVHHGNGTQHLFEERTDVFYASIHQYPFYPGTGARAEIGTGPARGFTKNIPFPAGTGDAGYLRAVEYEIVRAIDEFAPHAILISAGFDAHVRDPLGGMRLSAAAFGAMTQRIVEAAERHCDGRVLSLLEGGYDPEGLASSVAEHVRAME